MKSLILLTMILTCFLPVSFGQPSGKFKSVRIGNQEWMATNLEESKFRNGDLIPEAKTNKEWEKAGQEKKPAWSNYKYDLHNGSQYGKLYNWYAVSDPRGLAPKGWHIASDADWTALTDFLGGESSAAGRALKTKTGWEENNGTDQYGFAGLPGGDCNPDGGTTTPIGIRGMWWTSSENSNNKITAWYRPLASSEYAVLKKNFTVKECGFSVRCVKD